jgi:hypothetical protein
MKAFDVELSCKPHMVCGSFCNANIDSNFGVFWHMQVTLVMAYLNGNDIPDFFQLRTLITKAGFFYPHYTNHPCIPIYYQCRMLCFGSIDISERKCCHLWTPLYWVCATCIWTWFPTFYSSFFSHFWELGLGFLRSWILGWGFFGSWVLGWGFFCIHKLMAWDVSTMLMSCISDFAVFGNNLHHLFWPTGKGLDHGMKIHIFVCKSNSHKWYWISNHWGFWKWKNWFVNVKSLMSL